MDSSPRRGCPLLSLLFVLSLEPVVQDVQQSTNHDPIIVHNTKHHISPYADDILLFIQNTPQSLPHFLHIFNKFSLICIPVIQNLKYVEVSVHPSVKSTVPVNYKKMLVEVKN